MKSYHKNNLTIDPILYQHPTDKLATKNLVESKFFRQAMEVISKNSVEQILRGVYFSTYLHLNETTAPEMYGMMQEAKKMFGVEKSFDMFLHRTYDMSALLLGVDKPTVLFSSELIKQLDPTMLFGLVASQVAAQRTGFCEIRTLLWALDFLNGLIPDSITKPLRVLITQWRKYAQLTFDRSALLATGDFNKTMCQILSGETTQEVLRSIDFTDPDCGYMKQCLRYLETDGKAVDVLKGADAVLSGVSYPMRYLELKKFYEGEYCDLMDDYGE